MQNLKREFIFKIIFLLRDGIAVLARIARSLVRFGFTLASFGFFCLIIFDFGFRKNEVDVQIINYTYLILLFILFGGKILVELFSFHIDKWLAFLLKFFVLAIAFLTLLIHLELIPVSLSWLNVVLHNKQAVIICSLALMITESYQLSSFLSTINISASFLFAGSFVVMIFIGSGLLMLPNATTEPISYLDALFTSTSAVCVTGLTVVDTASVYSPLGKVIIMALIQIGGLGIMTFTAFFSYIFLGSASLKDRFLLKDFFSSEQMGSLYKLLLKILLITMIIEAAGATLIYHSLEGYWVHKLQDSIFHAISAFCNAGFSVYPEGLYTPALRLNYSLQITICALIFLGGIGFPVLMTLYNYLKQRAKSSFNGMTGRKMSREVFMLSIGESLALNTTVVLLIIGAVLYYLFEANSWAQDADMLHNMMLAFFASVSARTAGFNVVDPAMWSSPTVFLIIFLMWVGASPGSTGGGIKTTTFAIAVKAVINFLRGRNRLEIGNREIGIPTLVRVFSVIILSLAFIFAGFMLLLIFEPYGNAAGLLFECVSAFATVGLSILDTAMLSEPSKIVLMLLMFIGRIGPIVLLSGFLLTNSNDNYRLPVENIKIN